MGSGPSPFSFRRNVASLLHRPPSSIPMLDGVRALSISWVVALHSFKVIVSELPPEAAREWASHPWLRVFWAGDLGVDAFFVMSGFLICRLLLDELEATNGIRIGRFYLRRALRLLPLYYVLLAIGVVLRLRRSETAWANLLYINNFLPERRQFMMWTWSLAIEEQFYLVFPLLLLGLARLSLVTRMRALSLLLVLSLLVPIAVAVHYRLGFPIPVFASVDRSAFEHHFDTIYDKPYTRCGALLLGVLVEHARRYTRVSEWLGRSSMTVAFSSALLFGAVAAIVLIPFRDPDYASSLGWFPYLFVAEHRYVYGAAVAYAMLLCFSEHPLGRLLDRALSHRAFYPIAQLSYSAYLVNFLVIVLAIKIAPQTHIPSAVQALARTVGVFVAVFAVSSVLYVFVERPFINMRR
jgi:peptidoglycan/LPS O-acetylase OafA/YrhL